MVLVHIIQFKENIILHTFPRLKKKMILVMDEIQVHVTITTEAGYSINLFI